MSGNRAFPIAALLAVICVLGTAISRADTLWSNLLSPNRIEADPAKKYVLKEEHGPWILIACSFNGVKAPQQAHDLVLELRKRYRMEAFEYEHKFDLDDPNGDVQPIFRSPHHHVYHMFTENPAAYRGGAIKEIAVVVGNFPAIDDPEAQKVLQKLKSADPECLHADPDGQSLSTWRKLQAGVHDLPKYIESRKQTGPMSHAFITRNPLLPEDYFNAKGGLDELVVKMNKNVEFSLLDCPGKYTVQVAHFTGEVIIKQDAIQAIESGAAQGPESAKQTLAVAAEKAHDLTKALRIKGYEAYEFHDRYASLVTVGHFDSVGTPRPDGKIEINPQIHALIEIFRAKPGGVPTHPEAIKMESLVGIFFDVQPIPVEVPKRSISRQLSQRLDMAGQ